MDATEPKILANKVLLQVIQHSLGSDVPVSAVDYSVMRVVYRWCGGSWERYLKGNQLDIELLKLIVGAWGSMPGRLQGVVV